MGRSEATERPRDGQQIVADLHQLLQQQGHKPPYVLLGHSLGGLYMQLFARQYPKDVKGLLLVDALYPGAKTVVLDSDHQIQKAKPEAVAQAIQELLSAPL